MHDGDGRRVGGEVPHRVPQRVPHDHGAQVPHGEHKGVRPARRAEVLFHHGPEVLQDPRPLVRRQVGEEVRRRPLLTQFWPSLELLLCNFDLQSLLLGKFGLSSLCYL